VFNLIRYLLVCSTREPSHGGDDATNKTLLVISTFQQSIIWANINTYFGKRYGFTVTKLSKV